MEAAALPPPPTVLLRDDASDDMDMTDLAMPVSDDGPESQDNPATEAMAEPGKEKGVGPDTSYGFDSPVSDAPGLADSAFLPRVPDPVGGSSSSSGSTTSE